MPAARFTIFVYVKIRVGEIARVEIVLAVDLQARKLHLACGGELSAPKVVRRHVKIISKDRCLINGIIEKRLVVNYVSITLEKNVDRGFNFQAPPR